MAQSRQWVSILRDMIESRWHVAQVDVARAVWRVECHRNCCRILYWSVKILENIITVLASASCKI